LEVKSFRLSRFKIEYIKCDFSTTTPEEGDVRLDGQVIPKKRHISLLGIDTQDRRMEISMKMLVIELKSAG
jgi:hypothetical protein